MWMRLIDDQSKAMTSKQRRAITISGIVQGVGFRPFVYSLASQLKLYGFVQNRSGELLIEVEGGESVLNQFTERLQIATSTVVTDRSTFLAANSGNQ